MDELLKMSAKELSRLEVMQKLSEKRMSQKEAGRMLGLSVRQVKRLVFAYGKQGGDWFGVRRKDYNRLTEV